eukprot:TRINITY_DN33884_c0_g1_i2.p1 TRINITY_DN33884_c0_g1~~TRINITY_DN33884_c0_g1_i2.p1  ORF type:complete len:317 (-),score=36.80 TRINITY_DN33884_c0_g1_i2:352-1302(-)
MDAVIDALASRGLRTVQFISATGAKNGDCSDDSRDADGNGPRRSKRARIEDGRKLDSKDSNVPDKGSFAVVRCAMPGGTFQLSVSVAAGDAVSGVGIAHGQRLWGSGFVLAAWLASTKFAVSRDVLELGSGVGLGGLFAAASGASSVVLTDRQGPALELLRSNVSLNATALQAKVSVAEFDWASTKCDLGAFDAIIASDVLYDVNGARLLVDVLQNHLRPGGCFACVDPGRDGGEASARCVLARRFACLSGWKYEEAPLRDETEVAGSLVAGVVPVPPALRPGSLGVMGGGAGIPLRRLIDVDVPYCLVKVTRLPV